MGEFITADGDELTEEELALLEDEPDGEEEPADTEPPAEEQKTDEGGVADTSEPDPDPEQKESEASEAAGTADDEKHKPAKENLIPQSKFDERVKKIREESEKKLDLFRTDQDEYYRQYPDEKPAAQEPAAGVTQKAGDPDWDNIYVQGGTYDGKSINEVHRVDPATATAMQYNYFQIQQNEEAERLAQAEADKQAGVEDAQKEIDEFAADVSQELYGKVNGLTQDEQAKVSETIQNTLDWMDKHRRGGANMRDGHYLMTRDTSLAAARADGAKAIHKTITSGSVQRISSGRSSGQETGYEADMAMSANALADKLDKMTDEEATKYLSKAPEEFRKKYPDLDYS